MALPSAVDGSFSTQRHILRLLLVMGCLKRPPVSAAVLPGVPKCKKVVMSPTEKARVSDEFPSGVYSVSVRQQTIRCP